MIRIFKRLNRFEVKLEKKYMRTTLSLMILILMFSRASAQEQLPTAADIARGVSLSNLKSDNKTMIALVFGQSNAANHGQKAYTPHNASVLNYFDGKLHTAKDPLFGNTGTGGSVWTHLGDMLIDSGLYNKVIFIPIAIGGTEIDCWVNGDCYQKLEKTLKQLAAQHIRVTHIFWHQGESDNISNTPTAKYKEQLGAILQDLRKYQPADFYVSLASYHPSSVTKPLGVDSVIRNAQKEFINENKGVLLGPDTDTLIYAIYRFDSVHFSDYGMNAYARLWYQSIKEKKEKTNTLYK
jgi:hypothetical protein